MGITTAITTVILLAASSYAAYQLWLHRIAGLDLELARMVAGG